MYTIEKGIPVPEDIGLPANHYLSPKPPFAQMEVGDCFKVHDRPKQRGIQLKAHLYGRRHKKVFATKTIANILHIWRIA